MPTNYHLTHQLKAKKCKKNENFGEVGNPLPTVPTFQKKKKKKSHCTSAQRRPLASPPVIRPKSPNVRLVEKILSQQYQQSNIPKQKKKIPLHVHPTPPIRRLPVSRSAGPPLIRPKSPHVRLD
jgi:hypothetical protein